MPILRLYVNFACSTCYTLSSCLSCFYFEKFQIQFTCKTFRNCVNTKHIIIFGRVGFVCFLFPQQVSFFATFHLLVSVFARRNDVSDSSTRDCGGFFMGCKRKHIHILLIKDIHFYIKLRVFFISFAKIYALNFGIYFFSFCFFIIITRLSRRFFDNCFIQFISDER